MPKVVINEVMWSGSSLSTDDQWIELRNTTDKDINIGKWNKKINIRVIFDNIIPEGTTAKESVYCIIYIDGKPFVGNHNLPVVFYEGSSIDVTASKLSIGFHQNVNNNIKGTVKGKYYIRKMKPSYLK